MRKTKYLLGAVLALCLMAFSAQAASADSLATSGAWTPVPPATLGTGTSSGTGQHTFTIAGGNLVVRCTQASTQGTIVNAHTATVNMNYTNCSVTIAGIARPATVVDACNWTVTLTHGSYDPITGSSSGTITTCGTTTITVPSINCVVSVGSTTVPGTGQNLQNGVAQPSPANQLRLTPNATNVAWSQNGNCPGVPLTGTDGTYSGVTIAPGIWVVP